MRPLALSAVLVGSALVCSSCSGAGEDTVTVLAAASLTGVMTQVESLLEQQDPGLDLQISYAGSAEIVAQVNEGVEAEVILLAGEGPLERLDTAAAAAAPTFFATNTLTVVVAPGNPASISGVQDLARDDILLVLCAEQVPCGAAAAEMFERAEVTPRVASYEPDVRATLGKVSSGEADAGVVYVTDLAAAAQPVDPVAIPDEVNVVNRYPALSLGGSAAGAQLVVDLQTPQVQAVFARAGFGAP